MARKNNSVRLQAECLEDRKLMAANAVIDWYSKNLFITGTEQADTVFVNNYTDVGGDQVGSGHLQRCRPTQYFKRSDINSIVSFSGLGGNDYFNNNVQTLRTSAQGGEGDDTLLGDALQDSLKGGNGNDYIAGMDAYDELSGDAGNDNIYGGNGSDWMYGGDGNDYLMGEAGDDYMFGHKGKDSLYGGDGNDELYGGLNSDLVSGVIGNGYIRDVETQRQYGSKHVDGRCRKRHSKRRRWQRRSQWRRHAGPRNGNRLADRRKGQLLILDEAKPARFDRGFHQARQCSVVAVLMHRQLHSLCSA